MNRGLCFRIAATAAALLAVGASTAGAAPPVNDDFAARIPMPAEAFSGVAGSNAEATLEPGEPDLLGTGGASVWWSWTAPVSGACEVNTFGSDFDTIVYVFTGAQLEDLAAGVVAQSDNSNVEDQSRTQFNAVAGTTYHVSVHGKAGATGTIRLKIRPFSTASDNDAFAARRPLPGLAWSGAGADNTGAGLEPGEPDPMSAADSTLWWSWTAPSTGSVQIDTLDSDFDTVLYVYTGTSLEDLVLVGANDQAEANTSRVRIAATAGTTYHIAVGRFAFSGAAAGILSLNIAPGSPPSPPPNDAFVDRLSLGSGFNGSASGSNLGATTEPHEPLGSVFGDNSVWWTWTAPASGEYAFDTAGSSFNTVLTLYSGNNLAAGLVEQAAGGASPGSHDTQVLLNAVGGETYAIRVSGLEGASGNISLQFGPNFTPPAGPYAAWLANYPGIGDVAPSADPDRDGYSNLLELALGLNPTVNSTGSGDPAAAHAPAIFDSPGFMEIRYTVVPGNLGGGSSAIQVMGEWATMLEGPWNAITPDALGSNRFRVRVPIDAADRKFLRVRVSDPAGLP